MTSEQIERRQMMSFTSYLPLSRQKACNWMVILVCMTLLACQRSVTNENAPNNRARLILVYITCSLNKSFLSPYNSEATFTPHLANFAQDSLTFLRHHTEIGYSGIAHASIYSGSQAYHHGIYTHAGELKDEVYLLSEALSSEGYDAFFWDGHPLASKRHNFAQGIEWEKTFSRYDQPRTASANRHFGLLGTEKEFLQVLDRLRSDREYRVFILTTNAVPHGPYQISRLQEFKRTYPEQTAEIDWSKIDRLGEIYRENRRQLQFNFAETVINLSLSPEDISDLIKILEAAYKTQVNMLDGLFGTIVAAVDARGLRDKSLVLFTSDHGEILFRENALFKWCHGWELTPEVLNVPLVIRLPALAARSGSYPNVTRSIDIFPTVLGLSGLPIPDDVGIEGVDLTPAILGKSSPPKLLAFSHTTLRSKRQEKEMGSWTLYSEFFPRNEMEYAWVSVRAGDLFLKKRTFGPDDWGYEAFDLNKDPLMMTNLFDPNNADHMKMKEYLENYKTRLTRGFYELSNRQVLSDRTKKAQLKALKALGYVD